MDAGSKQSSSEPASPAQAREARVIRSCSRCWPPLSIVPNAAADGTGDAMHTVRTSDATRRTRRHHISAPSDRNSVDQAGLRRCPPCHRHLRRRPVTQAGRSPGLRHHLAVMSHAGSGPASGSDGHPVRGQAPAAPSVGPSWRRSARRATPMATSACSTSLSSPTSHTCAWTASAKGLAASYFVQMAPQCRTGPRPGRRPLEARGSRSSTYAQVKAAVGHLRGGPVGGIGSGRTAACRPPPVSMELRPGALTGRRRTGTRGRRGRSR
jgi:hypothetical protein